MKDFFLGVDVGTSYSKGVLARGDGTIVARAERAHDVSIPRPGWAEHDAEEVWWADFLALCRELLPQAPDGVAGVAVSGLGPCFLPSTADGRPLRPAILYGIDTRATREIDELTEQFGRDEILGRCGSALTSQAIGPKILWTRRNEPSVWQRTERFYMVNSYVIGRLTGEYVLDHHSASQCDPLYDVNANTWIKDWAHGVAPGLELPRLLWPTDVAGTVSAEGSRATGIEKGTPVATGTIDAWAEATSVGVRQPGDAMLMYGTALTLVNMVAPLRPLEAMWGVVGAFPGIWSVAGGVTTSGALTKWFRRITGDPPFEQLIAEARATEAGANGLVVLPYFSGERNPFYDPDARGVVAGLSLAHSRGDVYRALLEAAAFGVRHMLDALLEADASPRRLVAVGGGTRGGLWPQIVSDVTGLPQELPRETIGASYGDAYFAAIAAGHADPSVEWNSVASVVSPDGSLADRYEELYAIFRSLYPATLDEVHALAAFGRRQWIGPEDVGAARRSDGGTSTT